MVEAAALLLLASAAAAALLQMAAAVAALLRMAAAAAAALSLSSVQSAVGLVGTTATHDRIHKVDRFFSFLGRF